NIQKFAVLLGPPSWPRALILSHSPWLFLGTADNEIVASFNRWPDVITTKGHLSQNKTAYVTDDIEIPVPNPWRRNVRLADIAFFSDGRAAAVTFDGDVWIISGLAGDLNEVKWRRFASCL